LFELWEIEGNYGLIFLTAGFIYFGIIYARYRNKGARHYHESETKATVDKLRKKDTFVAKRTGLKNAKIEGANNKSVKGSTVAGFKIKI